MKAAFSPVWRLTPVVFLWSAMSVASFASEDYMTRTDAITSDAGEAVARNKVIQTIDPWPLHAGRTNTQTDGERMLLSIDRYQKNESLELWGGEGSGASGEQSSGPSGSGE